MLYFSVQSIPFSGREFVLGFIENGVLSGVFSTGRIFIINADTEDALVHIRQPWRTLNVMVNIKVGQRQTIDIPSKDIMSGSAKENKGMLSLTVWYLNFLKDIKCVCSTW